MAGEPNMVVDAWECLQHCLENPVYHTHVLVVTCGKLRKSRLEIGGELANCIVELWLKCTRLLLDLTTRSCNWHCDESIALTNMTISLSDLFRKLVLDTKPTWKQTLHDLASDLHKSLELPGSERQAAVLIDLCAQV